MPMNDFAFIVVTLWVFAISGVIWVLVKFLAKAGIFLIPIMSGVAAAAITPEDSSDLGMLAVLPFVAALTTLGVAGTLACYLHATIFDLEHRLDSLKRKRE